MNQRAAHEDKVILVLTLIIGAVVGLVVVAFILLTERIGSRLYPPGPEPWRRLLIPVVGALLTGYFLQRYFPNARGSGIPQTKAALFLNNGYISLRTVLGKFGLCSASLGSGIALGREGPSVQVGAGIASVLGRRLGLSNASVKSLLPVGASAALAAAFNTPIAAVLFSLEEVMGDMHAPVLGSIVISSATSWMVLHLVLGDEPLFHVPPYQLVHPIEFLVYSVLGLAGGLMSVAFVKLLLWQRARFKRLPVRTQWLQPTVGGLTVGILGWFVPEVLGVGYGFVGQALNGQVAIKVMALLILLKMVATATCYSSGNAGGIFGPSLFMGAMLGGTVGGIVHSLAPDYTGSIGAYALVGMGAAFAGIVRVPLTSVIMIFEITRDYTIIVPLMISNLVAYYVSSKLQEEPIYEALQHQDGIHLPSGAADRDTLLTVAEAMRPASGAADHSTAHLHPDHSLDTALRRLSTSGASQLAVVGRTNVNEIVGTLSVQDILAAYAAEQSPVEPSIAPMPARRLVIGGLALIIGLGIVGGFLTTYYRAERTSRAERAYRTGEELTRAGRTDEAIAAYREALSVSHSVRDRLALGLALARGTRPDEALIYLNEVLRAEPANGPARLAVARIDAAQGRIDEAISQYQRAVYGSWPDNSDDNRVAVRLEMIGVLTRAHRTDQAAGELASLAASRPDDVALHTRIADQFTTLGMPSRAAAQWHEVLRLKPNDRDALTGLGDAEWALNDCDSCRDAFHAAHTMPAREQACADAAALDTEAHGIRPAERRRRERALAAAVSSACAQPVKDAEAAEDLWRSRGGCTPPDTALARVMAKIGK